MSVKPIDKFSLLADLGFIVVPNDYEHSIQLARFKERHQGGKEKTFDYFNQDITDSNFSNPSRILLPGEKLRVRVFHQVVSGTTTSKERTDFLLNQGVVYVGAQGASLVYDQKHDSLPKGKWYASYDEDDRLWKDSKGDHGLPGIRADRDGVFFFNLCRTEYLWNDYNAMICFNEC